MGLASQPEREITKPTKKKADASDLFDVSAKDLLDGLEKLRAELSDATTLGTLVHHPGYQVLMRVMTQQRDALMERLVHVDATEQRKVIELQAEVKALNFYLNLVPQAASAAGALEQNLRQRLEERDHVAE